ncbi:hypothetical protein WN944_001605 [Citrus x changshan-huyou]|uniref:Uncharacterized protein n=1 Tax=Citrus x changshan-huyou TaxID=2935761 RepID=A0AAP0ML79_9ROSI
MPKFIRRRDKKGENDEFSFGGFGLFQSRTSKNYRVSTVGSLRYPTQETGGPVFMGYASTKTSSDEQTSGSRVPRTVRESRHEGHATTHDYRYGASTFERWEDNEHEWREGLSSEGAYKKVANEGTSEEEALREEILVVIEFIEQKPVEPNSRWFKGNSRFKSPTLQMHKEIVDFCDFLSPTSEEREVRTTAGEAVLDLFKYTWPKCKDLRGGAHFKDYKSKLLAFGDGGRQRKKGAAGRRQREENLQQFGFNGWIYFICCSQFKYV